MTIFSGKGVPCQTKIAPGTTKKSQNNFFVAKKIFQ